MTIRVTYNQTCDRCERPFDQKVLKAGATVPAVKSRGIAVYATTTTEGALTISKTPLAAFEDLCDGCRDAVKKLVDKIQLSTKRKVKATPAEATPAVLLEPGVEGLIKTSTTTTKTQFTPAATTSAPGLAQSALDAVVTHAEDTPPVKTREAPVEAAEAAPAEAAPEDTGESKPKRKRRTKAEMAAARTAEAAGATEAPAEAQTAAEETPEDYTEEPDAGQLGLAGDDNAKAREAETEEEVEVDPDDPWPGREVFEDPSTGDIIDVHSGEVLAKREDGGDAGADQNGTHPF